MGGLSFLELWGERFLPLINLVIPNRGPNFGGRLASPIKVTLCLILRGLHTPWAILVFAGWVTPSVGYLVHLTSISCPFLKAGKFITLHILIHA